MYMPRCTLIYLFLLLSVAGAAVTAGADPNKAQIEPEANEKLMQMSKTLSTANAFGFKAAIDYDDLLPSGQKIQFGGVVRGLVQRPGSVYTEYSGGLANTKIWMNEKSVTVLDIDHNFYGRIDTPGGIDESMDYMMKNHDFSLPLADIFHSDPFDSLTATTTEGIYVGDSNISGNTCSHLAFVGKEADWQIWLSKDTAALPCRLLITYKNIAGAPQYEATFTDWKINPEFNNSIFDPEIPQGAGKIEFSKIKDGGSK